LLTCEESVHDVKPGRRGRVFVVQEVHFKRIGRSSMSIDIEAGLSTGESSKEGPGDQWPTVLPFGTDQGSKPDGERRRAGRWIGWVSTVVGAGGVCLGCGEHELAGSMGDVAWAVVAVSVLAVLIVLVVVVRAFVFCDKVTGELVFRLLRFARNRPEPPAPQSSEDAVLHGCG
jgi:hypothetical protein